MQTEIIEVMRTQVRAIHRALTGDDPPELELAAEQDIVETPQSDEEIIRSFRDLDAVMRTLPAVAARVPPFSFTPTLDVIAGDQAVILELALPGVARTDVAVERVPGGVVVSGVRRHDHGADGRTFHAETPRGPFHRAIPLGFPIVRVELEHGVLRIHLACSAAIPATQDRSSTTGEPGNDDDGHE